MRHGTSSSISLGASCPSDCANGPTGSDQWDLVEIAEINLKLRERGLLRGFYEFHGVRGDRLQAEGFYTSLVSSLDNDTPLFVLSFCRHTEEKTIKHGLLSQRRAYAGSAGFAIEFDVDELDELMRVECDTFAYPDEIRLRAL